MKRFGIQINKTLKSKGGFDVINPYFNFDIKFTDLGKENIDNIGSEGFPYKSKEDFDNGEDYIILKGLNDNPDVRSPRGVVAFVGSDEFDWDVQHDVTKNNKIGLTQSSIDSYKEKVKEALLEYLNKDRDSNDLIVIGDLV